MMFYFDTVSVGAVRRDDDGCRCSGLDDARRHARRILCEIANDSVPERERIAHTVRVRDATGAEVYKATLLITGTPYPTLSALLSEAAA